MWNDEDTLPYDLPDWMRQARQGVDWGLLLVLAFSLLAAWPFLIDLNLPQTNGSEQVVYQTANIAASIQEGRFYPRWSPHVLGELGAPIPNFYPPGPAYLAALIQVLLTNDPISAARITYVLVICAAGIAVYVLMLRRVNATAGILAAVLTVYSPYLAVTAPHILGDLTAITITALIAALLWALDRLLMTRHPMDLVTATLLFAGLILTNPVAAIVGAAISLGYAVWLRQTTPARFRIRAVWIPLILGIGVASFYWIPALLEQDAITWVAPDIQAQPLEFNLTNLLAPPHLIDPEILRPEPQLTLGLVHGLIAIGGLAAIIVSRRWRVIQGFFVLSGLTVIGLALTVLRSESWIVGLLSLCAAMVGSALPYLMGRLPPARRRLILPVLLILIWITCAPDR
ncbi:MAG: glycosyltransferase family 39 protein, partial [Anaerolineae bacterium]|nr:glycosyltransferase family 39 protein [Anaerolineae bacterium]